MLQLIIQGKIQVKKRLGSRLQGQDCYDDCQPPPRRWHVKKKRNKSESSSVDSDTQFDRLHNPATTGETLGIQRLAPAVVAYNVYDTITHDSIWIAMTNIGISQKIVTFTKFCISNTRCRVKKENSQVNHITEIFGGELYWEEVNCTL